MIKIMQHRGILSVFMISIIFVVAYFFFANQANIEIKHLMLSLLFIAAIGICFFAIFSGVKKAKSAYDKVLTALIGNILLNILFIVALYFVVITFLN